MRIYRSVLASLLLGAGASVSLAGPVNINTADAATLAAELSGIGPALAEAIVADREQNGMFNAPEDLARVRGIGERVLEMNAGDILINNPPAAR